MLRWIRTAGEHWLACSGFGWLARLLPGRWKPRGVKWADTSRLAAKGQVLTVELARLVRELWLAGDQIEALVQAVLQASVNAWAGGGGAGGAWLVVRKGTWVNWYHLRNPGQRLEVVTADACPAWVRRALDRYSHRNGPALASKSDHQGHRWAWAKGRSGCEVLVAAQDGAPAADRCQALLILAGLAALVLEREQERQRAERALQQREILLREIHHRVKNNLQVISSLLSLQARAVQDPSVAEVLEDSRNRVRSIAMLHEQLYRSSDVLRVSFASYARSLVGALFSAYGVDSGKVRLLLEVPDVTFAVDTAVPCGLILQELVSNALKHAFTGRRQGRLVVGLARQSNGFWRLWVEDDGPGLPPQFQLERTPSLGLRLVRVLAQQLEAQLWWENHGGTRFVIEFPDRQAGALVHD